VKVPKPPSLWRATGWLLGAGVAARVSTLDLHPDARSRVLLCLFMLVLFGYATVLLWTDGGEP
jgi:hypothetical protein